MYGLVNITVTRFWINILHDNVYPPRKEIIYKDGTVLELL